MNEQGEKVVVITGPTAAGKTELAIALAREFGGQIVNADSMQVYRHLDIGTAKPSLEQRATVPHHLIDIVLPDDAYSAGRYLRDARAAATGVHAAGHPVMLTGGTGLYIRAFLEGLVDAGSANEEVRARWEDVDCKSREAGDTTRLHRELAVRDPVAAEKLHPNDVRRLVRALELCERGSTPPSNLTRDHGFADRPYRSLHLVIDPGREALVERIDARCRAMIDGGLLQEVRRLREMGYGPELRSLQAIGYRHMAAVVDGSDTLVNALESMRADTRRFARRQRTWLRGVPDARWIHPDDESALRKAVGDFLGSDQ